MSDLPAPGMSFAIREWSVGISLPKGATLEDGGRGFLALLQYRMQQTQKRQERRMKRELAQRLWL